MVIVAAIALATADNAYSRQADALTTVRASAAAPATIRGILWPLRSHHPERMFTYVAQRTRDKRVKGRRYPLTYFGVKIAWRRLRKRAKVTGFRVHDFRHDLGTKLLRATGNLKLVQRALPCRSQDHDAVRSRARRRSHRRPGALTGSPKKSPSIPRKVG